MATTLPVNIQLFAEGNADPDNNSGNNANQDGGNSSDQRTYTQEELDRIVTDRTGRATKSALASFFKQRGLSEDEANSAITAYLDNKAKNTPDVAKLQNDLVSANSARLSAEINQAATLEAIKQGVDIKSIPYLLKMADFKSVSDDNGIINAEKLTEAVKKVLDDVPALKVTSQQNGGNGFRQIGGDGGKQSDTNEDMLRNIFGIKK